METPKQSLKILSILTQSMEQSHSTAKDDVAVNPREIAPNNGEQFDKQKQKKQSSLDQARETSSGNWNTYKIVAVVEFEERSKQYKVFPVKGSSAQLTLMVSGDAEFYLIPVETGSLEINKCSLILDNEGIYHMIAKEAMENEGGCEEKHCVLHDHALQIDEDDVTEMSSATMTNESFSRHQVQSIIASLAQQQLECASGSVSHSIEGDGGIEESLFATWGIEESLLKHEEKGR